MEFSDEFTSEPMEEEIEIDLSTETSLFNKGTTTKAQVEWHANSGNFVHFSTFNKASSSPQRQSKGKFLCEQVGRVSKYARQHNYKCVHSNEVYKLCSKLHRTS